MYDIIDEEFVFFLFFCHIYIQFIKVTSLTNLLCVKELNLIFSSQSLVCLSEFGREL